MVDLAEEKSPLHGSLVVQRVLPSFMNVLVLYLSLWLILQMAYLFKADIFGSPQRWLDLGFCIAPMLTTLIILSNVTLALPRHESRFRTIQETLMHSGLASIISAIVAVSGIVWGFLSTVITRSSQPLCAIIGNLGLSSHFGNTCTVSKVNYFLSILALLLLGICYFILPLCSRGSAKHSLYTSRGTSEGRLSTTGMPSNDLEAQDIQSRYDLGCFQHRPPGPECSRMDDNRSSLPYLPVAARSSENPLIVKPDQGYSPLNPDQTLGMKSSKPFLRLTSMYSTRKIEEEECANIVANTPTTNTTKDYATRPTRTSLSLPTISPLARRTSIASSLNSHPWTCTMSSSPSSTAGQARTPKIPPIPTRYYVEQLAPDELSTIPVKGTPERPKSRPELPPQAFWSYCIDAATEHLPDSTIVCNSGYTGASQPSKLEETETTRGRYSFLLPDYQGSKASSIYDEYIPEMDSNEFRHACSEISYENLRKGGPAIMKEASGMGQVPGGEGVTEEGAGKEQVRRKRSRTLVKQRQPLDGGIGIFAKGGGRSWITIAR